jgi:hypothetical protein
MREAAGNNAEAGRVIEAAVTRAAEVAADMATASDVAAMRAIRQAAVLGPEATAATIQSFANFAGLRSGCDGAACGFGCGAGCAGGCLIGGIALVGFGAAGGTAGGAGTAIVVGNTFTAEVPQRP